jgi:hypothetical protein
VRPKGSSGLNLIGIAGQFSRACGSCLSPPGRFPSEAPMDGAADAARAAPRQLIGGDSGGVFAVIAVRVVTT